MNETPKTYQVRFGFLAGLTVFAIVARLLPWALGKANVPDFLLWGFTPLFAISLFGAAHFQDRRWAYAVPLLTYAIGDLGILAITGDVSKAIYPDQPVVYGTVALIVLGGTLLRRHRTPLAIAGAGLAGSLLFYVTTNFGVWYFGDGSFYAHNLGGLIACYVAGLMQLLRNVASCWLFSGILFSRLGVEVLEAQSVDGDVAMVPSATVAARAS